MTVAYFARNRVGAGLIAVFGLAATTDSAQAFGDRCYGNVRVTGQKVSSMQDARASARAAWENTVSRRYGANFAAWTYSGDRTFECSWNGDGQRIRCIADAVPCGRL
jgi:hypothetical protein